MKYAQFVMESSSFSNLNATSRNKWSCTELQISYSDTDKVDSFFHRWFVSQSVNQEQPLSKLSPFLIYKAIKTAIGTVKDIKCLRSDLIIQVTTASQSRTVNKLGNLAGWPVTTSPHRTLNTCKGVIKCALLTDCYRDGMLKELEPQGVTDIVNISVKDDSGGSRNTNTFIITFRTPTTPQPITVGYLRVPVSIYIPDPVRCYKCQKFGHGKTPEEEGRRAKCGQTGHRSDQCTIQTKCANCSGDHSSFSKDCPKWVFEKRVQQVKAERGIAFIEAHRVVTAESNGRPVQGSCTAAAVVGSNKSGPTLASWSAATQTDLT